MNAMLNLSLKSNFAYSLVFIYPAKNTLTPPRKIHFLASSKRIAPDLDDFSIKTSGN
jgi:hypothetical protein